MLDLWRSDFGDSYTTRNVPLVKDVFPVLERMLGDVLDEVWSVFEPGCNRGHNLLALAANARLLIGLEPNAASREIALHSGLAVIDGDVCALPFAQSSIDLVLTSGLLIHLPPDKIVQGMFQIARVARKYVLTIEYAAATEEMVSWRDLDDICWKRPYGKLYDALGLEQVGGEEVCSDLYPGCQWFLHRK